MQLKTRMLSSTVMPFAVVVGMAGAVTAGSALLGQARANPCAAKRACNPCAAKRGCNPCAAKRGCNPCAARNPCAAKRGCNPCAAKKGCNPCGAGGAKYSSRCVIPRLQKAALCNPCAAKKGCNPCAAKKGCNPCAAKNPCNPCAAKKGCNPCAAKNPCNPCGAANPCGGAAAVELTAAEAKKAYDCILSEMRQAYGKSGLWVTSAYPKWKRYSKVAYQSSTHGGRFVQNYANAASYGRYEKAGKMKAGGYLVKDSFTVTKGGKVGVGPLFIMRKMAAGWNAASGDWKYAMVMPNGAYFGETNGKNSKNMTFCIECHVAVKDDQDSMFFLPEEYRR